MKIRPCTDLEASDPGALRAQVVASVVAQAGADVGLFYGQARLSDGRLSPTNVTATEDAAGMSEALGQGFVPMPDGTQTARRATRAFLDASTLFGSWEAFAARPATGYVRERFGLGDQIRLLAYQGCRCLGWIGAFRRWGQPRFTPSDRRRLAGLVESVTSTLAAATALAEDGLPGGSAYLIAAPDGRVAHASPEAAPWLARPGFQAELARTVRDHDRGATPAPAVALEEADASFARLHGEAGSVYLVCLRPLRRLTLSPLASLSPTQMRVAEYLAAGARRSEIAAALEVSAETVRSHVRAVYERLEVATPMELARLLEEHA
ncbi:MAG: helix-turn-helix transcriptional regulator [Myxococcales bacterium]|nr:helix-turn-helix transcriptional regulator [Myxococcales bacterium]